MLTWLSKHIFYPIWDIKDKSIKLKTLTDLETSQWLPERELRKKQWDKVKTTLAYAYQYCAFYKTVFDENKITPEDIKAPSDLLKIPLLTKKHIQNYTNNLISKKYTKNSLVSAKTGGSTGKALTLYFDKQCEEIRNAAAMRSDKWAKWDLGETRAALWGNPPTAQTWKEKLRNTLLDRILYLDTMNLNNKSMSDFVVSYRRFKPSTLYGHSHSIFILARFLEDQAITDISPSGIISTSMMLLPHERTVIEKVFKCKVTDRYGCEELGLIGCECEQHAGMHINIDYLYVEFIKEDGTTAKPGEEGNIVITDLINKGMPLIRYKVEDMGIPTDRKCPCGRGLPLMASVTGRVADFLLKKDGSLVAGVSLVERTLTAINGIEQMQIVQEAIDRIILYIVKGKGYKDESQAMLVEEFQSVFGKDIRIVFRYTDLIPQEKSGKYRFSICKILQP